MLPDIDESKASLEDARDKLVLDARRGRVLKAASPKVFNFLDLCARRFERDGLVRHGEFAKLIAEYKCAVKNQRRACPPERACRYRREADTLPQARGAPRGSPAKDGSGARAAGGGGLAPTDPRSQPVGGSTLVEGDFEIESVESTGRPGVMHHKGKFRLPLAGAAAGAVVAMGGVAYFGVSEYKLATPPDRASTAQSPTTCASPWVVVDTTFKRNGPEWAWPVARQFFAVFGNFAVVEGEPGVEEVQLAPYEYFSGESRSVGAYALVARCRDQTTCAKLAEKYIEVVGSPAKFSCDKPNVLGDAPVGRFAWSANRQEHLPAPDDYTALCARLNACQFAEFRAVSGSPFRECQADHTKFKTHCATMDSCKKVNACALTDDPPRAP
jgi:hypothetical protein